MHNITTEKLNLTNQKTTVRSVYMGVCIALCKTVAHNTTQNRPDNFPSFPPDNHHCLR